MSSTLLNELSDFFATVKQRTEFHAGYPYNLSYDYTPLFRFLEFSLNNLGDPFIESNYGINSRKFEQEVLDFFANLYKIATNDSWGYITACGTEGNLYGIFVGREVYPDGILYSSQDTHYSVAKAARLFRIEHVVLRSQETGEIEYDHFEEMIRENRGRPAIINLNIGTTMKGAIDNLDVVLDILERNNIQDYYIHCDGALSGMILPFLADAPQVSFTKPIGSISISGHKFIGSPLPCGVVLTRKVFLNKVETNIEYIGSKDTTILGSRNGHSPLFFWYALKTRGHAGLAKEINFCLENAQYLFNKLNLLKYPCMLNKFSNTVVFKKPPEYLIKKWQLAIQGDWVHIVVMQNIDTCKIDKFISDLKDCAINNLRANPKLVSCYISDERLDEQRLAGIL
ncbi:histidine decarboxylase [Chroococcidiopsis sp. CCMEE 29]|uniref:histidine decarboxylase n=1 Tax=Chroococcidiopsis sp. CCMEE 29 TaxID=155894 RepID=UPI0020226FEC|nr:histidine decarboxylase [Chroococcidiopsis sp. CCMEE 29]